MKSDNISSSQSSIAKSEMASQSLIDPHFESLNQFQLSSSPIKLGKQREPLNILGNAIVKQNIEKLMTKHIFALDEQVKNLVAEDNNQKIFESTRQ